MKNELEKDMEYRKYFLQEDKNFLAVRKNPHSLKIMEDPSHFVMMEAVRLCPRTIKYIESPSEELQIAAVSRNASYIEFIKAPTESVQIMAAKNNVIAFLRYVKNPSINAVLAAARKCPYNDVYIASGYRGRSEPMPDIVENAIFETKEIFRQIEIMVSKRIIKIAKELKMDVPSFSPQRICANIYSYYRSNGMKFNGLKYAVDYECARTIFRGGN